MQGLGFGMTSVDDLLFRAGIPGTQGPGGGGAV